MVSNETFSDNDILTNQNFDLTIPPPPTVPLFDVFHGGWRLIQIYGTNKIDGTWYEGIDTLTGERFYYDQGFPFRTDDDRLHNSNENRTYSHDAYYNGFVDQNPDFYLLNRQTNQLFSFVMDVIDVLPNGYYLTENSEYGSALRFYYNPGDINYNPDDSLYIHNGIDFQNLPFQEVAPDGRSIFLI